MTYTVGAVTTLILVWAATVPAHGHPHIWIDVENEILVAEDGRMSAVDVSWTFDEFYSAYAVRGMDVDRDGVFDSEELQPLADINMTELAHVGFFMEITTVDGTPQPFEAGTATADMQGNSLRLQFTLHLNTPVSPPLTIATFDPSYYVSLPFPDGNDAPVTVSGAGAGRCTVQLSRRSGEDLYFEDADLPSEAILALRAREQADKAHLSC